MTNDLIKKAEDALQDALLFKKNTLDQVADLVVTQLKHHTKESSWLCHVVPADVDTGLCYNFDCASSICFSFGDEKQKYEASISKLTESFDKTNILLSPTPWTPSTQAESSLCDILENSEIDPKNKMFLDESIGPQFEFKLPEARIEESKIA